MADGLKPMLGKVLSSAGKKKFFFAFGQGKRKDAKGEGELAIAGKRPKADDVKAALVACSGVVEGTCWSGAGPEDLGTVYFQGKGKKLAAAIVAKMALSAKRSVGKQYDFQLPSVVEESRADGMGESEADAEGEGEEDAAPEGGAADGGPAAAWKAKAKALLPAIQAALAAKGPAAQAVAKLLAQANALSKPGGDLAAATAKLVACHKLATGGGGDFAARTGNEVGDVAEEWRAKLAAAKPAIQAALAAKGRFTGVLAKLLAEANALAKAGKFSDALAPLAECYDMAVNIAEAKADAEARDAKSRADAEGPGAEAEGEAGAGAGDAEGSEAEAEDEDDAPATTVAVWNRAKDKASAAVGKLLAFLRTTKEAAMADVASQLELGTELALVNAKWLAALASFDSAAAGQRAALLPKIVPLHEAFVTRLTADPALAAVEANPVVPVAVKPPLLAALAAIRTTLDAHAA